MTFPTKAVLIQSYARPKHRHEKRIVARRSAMVPFRYALRPGVPHRFKTQVVSPDNHITEDDCANRFIVSARELFEVMKNRIPVERRTLDVFSHDIQSEFNFAADLSVEQAAGNDGRVD